jgi:hypothetical protein
VEIEMQDIYEKMGLFYLGEEDDKSLILYKSKHLTTHAMLIGMTGSGKTGLGISLIEEATIDNIPSIIIDPKGDMGNLCLAFPSLEPGEFEPWLEKSQDAQEMADRWRNGIESAHQDISRVKRFAQVEKSIYTPGSSAGIGVNILGSFNAPSKEILEDSDVLSSYINTTVSSLLALISVDSDPITSKEHLLLSNIFYYYYSREISLSMEDVIGYVASPPFDKIGILSLKSFYPQKDRMKLAMLLNGVISSVSFSSWIKGEALDIQNMLYDENGKAKVAIFSIAHLNDRERMFFVTILLNSYINWMRKQKGSATLKSILYMDEIFGFFPPSKNPPSKEPMLLLLKQARAFGTGVILSTQNPVDLDYKGLSNIGTWFVGKLQTKQDIDKVLEPLSVKSTLSKEQISKKLATLKGRHFFMKNVHSDETIEFSTRWVLSYLKGPMTKDDIRILMKDKKDKKILDVKIDKKIIEHTHLDKKPIIDQNIKEYFLDTNINSTTLFYPYLYASADVRFYNQKRAIDIVENLAFKEELYESQQTIEWENPLVDTNDKFLTIANTTASYASLPKFIAQTNSLNSIKKRLSNYLYTSRRIELFECKKLKLESKLNQSKRDFIVDVENCLKDKTELKLQKLESKFKIKLARLDDKLKRLEIKLQKEQHDVSSKTSETLIDVGLALFGAFFSKKSISATNIRRGAAAFKKGKSVFKERDDVESVNLLIQDVEDNIDELNQTLQEEILKIKDSLNIENFEITSVYLKPRRSDIIIKDIALLWER